MKEYEFYTAVFGVSRALGVLANGIWARIFGLPIERPNSIDMAFIEKLGQTEKKEWLDCALSYNTPSYHSILKSLFNKYKVIGLNKA